METAIKISTSFRLNAELVEKMKAAAKASNRSLNNFVESILLNVMYCDNPEDTTIASIEEARKQQMAYKKQYRPLPKTLAGEEVFTYRSIGSHMYILSTKLLLMYSHKQKEKHLFSNLHRGFVKSN